MLSADEVATIVREVTGRVTERVELDSAAARRRLSEVLNETLWWEQDRLAKLEPDDEAAIADRQFYAELRRQLIRAPETEHPQLLERVVRRYADEIAGTAALEPSEPNQRRRRWTDPTLYKVATKLAQPVFGALLTGLSPKRLLEGETVAGLDQHLIVEDGAKLARLRERGTLIVAPTHSSNLDALVMGFAVHQLGIPPLTYQAGRQLFRNPMLGRFMHRLGAVTVDRRKRDPLYQRTLAQFTTVSLERGQDNLLFPGGAPSRAGAIERTLEPGLLACSLAAYRNNLVHGRAKPNVYVVPCTISYPLVLEAASLIEGWLADAARSRHILVDDEFARLERWRDFLGGLFSLDLKIHLRFGPALDPFGNDVDDDGVSLDPRGRPISPRGYLEVGGEIVEDPIRDAEYTRQLEQRILAQFAADNVIHATHVLAFACFEQLRRARPELDLYRLLGSITPELAVELPELEAELEATLAELLARSQAHALRLSPIVEAAAHGQVRDLIRTALRSFGTYHTRAVVERRGVSLHVNDPQLLFYYRNRLDGYDLRGAPTLAGALARPATRHAHD